ncbi:uncharacterized protein LOC129572947 [Sitodiplosis mosellana]|uniref:uncharacterized protein LOC129572947 n=1 Tax=Sitodiplosis mosellana TaxID=263140 RepID=UPI0024447C7B|nr:uncharacterized protein LOC129572947 [Sitodiplosis mosellana]
MVRKFWVSAKRDCDGVKYLIKWNEQNPKVISSKEARNFAVIIIDYLQAQLVWHTDDDEETGAPELLTIEPKGKPSTVMYVTKDKDELVYFFKHSDSDISIMNAEKASVKYPELVLTFLESCIE